MGQIVLWALLTGGITGGVWAGIVLIARQRRLDRERLVSLEELEEVLEEHEEAKLRLAEMEERLGFAERLLAQRTARGELKAGEQQ